MAFFSDMQRIHLIQNQNVYWLVFDHVVSTNMSRGLSLSQITHYYTLLVTTHNNHNLTHSLSMHENLVIL